MKQTLLILCYLAQMTILRKATNRKRAAGTGAGKRRLRRDGRGREPTFTFAGAYARSLVLDGSVD